MTDRSKERQPDSKNDRPIGKKKKTTEQAIGRTSDRTTERLTDRPADRMTDQSKE